MHARALARRWAVVDTKLYCKIGPSLHNCAQTCATLRPHTDVADCLLHGVGVEVASGLDDGIARAPAQGNKHVRHKRLPRRRPATTRRSGAWPHGQADGHSHVGDVSAVGVGEGGVVGIHVVRGGGHGGGVRDGEGDEVADVLNQRTRISTVASQPVCPMTTADASHQPPFTA